MRGSRFFLNQSLSKGASWARMFTRTWEQPELSLGIESGPDGLEVIEPQAIMQQKAGRWAKLWKGTVGSPKKDFPDWLRNLG